MKHFVNVYVYTPSIADETWHAWWRVRFRPFYFTASLFIAAIVVIALFVKQPLYFLYEVFPVVAIIFMERRRRQIRKEEAERYKRFYQDETPTVRVEVGEHITLITPKNVDRITYDEVERMVRCGEMILITAKGGRYAALKKDGFLDGNADACMAWIRRQKKEHRKNRRHG